MMIIQQKNLVVVAILFLVAACSNNKVAFQDVIQDCAAPASMAGFSGPVIMVPAEGAIVGGKTKVEGSCVDGITVEIHESTSQTKYETNCVASKFSTEIVLSDNDGGKDLLVSQKTAPDGSDIVARMCFLKDATPPAVTITQGTSTQSVNSGLTTLTGTCETGLLVLIAGPGVSAPVTTACNDGNFSVPVSLIGGDGIKDVRATQIDLAGNQGQDTTNYILDSTPPVVRITAPSALTASNSSINLIGTCENGPRVGLGVLGTNAVQYTNCINGQFTIQAPLVGADGIKNLIVSQIDDAGNIGTDSRNFIKDTTPPNITISFPLADSFVSPISTFSGNCENNLPVQLSGTILISAQTISCVANAWTLTTPISGGQGSKILIATQIDLVGNQGQAQRSFQVDTVAPVIAFTSPNANSLVGSTFQIQGICETGLTVQISGSGVISGTTASCVTGAFAAIVTSTSGDGTKPVVISQTDLAGNTGTSNRSFIKDTTAPVITITSPANGSVFQNSLTLSGNCETGLLVSLSGAGIVANSSTNCTAGSYSANLILSSGDGIKVISASQTDSGGNTASATGNYIKDSTAPLVMFTSPLANTVGQIGLTVTGNCESGISVSLSGAGVAASTSTACTAGNFSSAIVFSNGDGAKNVMASQTDAAGNTGTDSRVFIRDATPPAITITSPAANSYLQATFVLTGACETGLAVSLSGPGIDAPSATVCTAGSYSTTLNVSAGDGVKTVTAMQTDLVGNTAQVSRNFTRSTAAPLLTITSPANGSVFQSSLTLIGACVPGLTVSFSGAGLASPSSVTCTAGGSYSSNLILSAGDGAKSITATETDPALNTAQVTGNYVKDSTAPVVAFTSPAANTLGQIGLTVTGTCEAGLNVTLAGSGVSSSTSTACTAGSFSSAITFSNGDGTKLVTASQTDIAGNVGSDSRIFLKDTTGPVVTITSPAANSYLPATFTLTGSCETGLVVGFDGAGIDAAAGATCLAGSYSMILTTSAGDGVKAVRAYQTDAIGNSGQATRNFLRDSTAPMITITSPANGSVFQTSLTLTGTCEAGLSVSISGAGVASNSSTTCASGTFSTNLTLSAGDGVKNITASQTDAAGNSAQANGSYLKDATAPVVAFTSPAANTVAQSGLTVTGTCEAGLNVTLAGSGVLTSSSTSCLAGNFSAAITFSNGDGSKTVTASQIDAVGNLGSASRVFIKDTTAPIVTIALPTANSYLPATFTLTGTCETGLVVGFDGAGIDPAAGANCVAGSYSMNLTTSAGDGVKAVRAYQTDAAGNSGQALRNFLRDTLAPAITITSPVNGSSVVNTENIIGTCETGLSVTISGDLQSTATGACSAGGFNISVNFTPSVGTKNITAKQTDAAGNLGQATAQYAITSLPGFETFVSDASFGKIDILFIDDNSASMDPEQAALAAKFSSFSTELSGIDWQIGITTTDCSTGPYGICGSLLQLAGTTQNILTPSMLNYQQTFKNTIQRPETPNCAALGTCPSGNEEPLLATMTAMDKRNSDNNNFFRADSALAVVVLSDEDEGSNGPPLYSGRPSQLVTKFNSIWPTGKQLRVYGIIVKPTDSTCLAQQLAQPGGFGFYGNLIDQTVNLTSGFSVSICAPDYNVTLKSIGESVRTLTNSVTLAQTPIAGTVSVNFIPAQAITFKVIGNKVVFDTPPSVGTQIQVNYNY